LHNLLHVRVGLIGQSRVCLVCLRRRFLARHADCNTWNWLLRGVLALSLMLVTAVISLWLLTNDLTVHGLGSKVALVSLGFSEHVLALHLNSTVVHVVVYRQGVAQLKEVGTRYLQEVYFPDNSEQRREQSL